jgi:predicted lysophospholipase L1 biosynthesis ABC-type transport system permease subunit
VHTRERVDARGGSWHRNIAGRNEKAASGTLAADRPVPRSRVPTPTYTCLHLPTSALALILGAVGLYGVLSYIVAERTREIGVRMALGATASKVQRMVVKQGALVVLVGVALGIGGALAATRALGTLLFGVAAADPLVFVVVPVMLLAVGMVASWLPARRASLVDPMEALRGE